ncbi:MAG: mechanosensitive ion channel family protein [Candidatus Campbellbacteria bacterium]|nr:mechanosensitive ion channel family protein [Candidatus Campbellbacteria bacterium]
MINRIITVLVLLILSGAAWLALSIWESTFFTSLFYTFVALATVYVVFKLIAEPIAVHNTRDAKSRYLMRKFITITTVVITLGAVLAIWVDDAQTLFVSYGIIGAGLAFALQDLFKNLAGGMLLFTKGIYRIGDRVEIDGSVGDVIDIGMLYTTLLEIQNWIDGDQTTGRMVIIPNNKVISGMTFNYSKDHSFIWDEIMVPITYESDWRKARDLMVKISSDETAGSAKTASEMITRLKKRYFISARETEPSVFMRLTDNWIQLTVRFVVPVKDRRLVNDRLSHLILETFEKDSNIEIASETFVVRSKQAS